MAPSLQFLLAVLVFGEAFTLAVHLPAFVLIWSGVGVYLVRTWRSHGTKGGAK